LLDVAEDAGLPNEKIKERLRGIQLERARIDKAMQDTSAQIAAGIGVLHHALALASHPKALYEGAADSVRRPLNQTYFEAFYLDDRGTVG
jgi:site-specific DNA recombinase